MRDHSAPRTHARDTSYDSTLSSYRPHHVCIHIRVHFLHRVRTHRARGASAGYLPRVSFHRYPFHGTIFTLSRSKKRMAAPSFLWTVLCALACSAAALSSEQVVEMDDVRTDLHHLQQQQPVELLDGLAFAADAYGCAREATHVVIGKLCSLFSRLASLAGAERLATRTTSRTTVCIELNAGYLSAGYQPV